MVAMCQNLKRLSKIMLAKPLILLVPEVGIEPTRGCPRGILSPVRLPVSPLRHLSCDEKISMSYNMVVSPFDR
jgi:hypothetical protein